MTALEITLLDSVKRREQRRFNRIEKAHYDQLIADGFVRLTPSGEYRITKAGMQRLVHELAEAGKAAKDVALTFDDTQHAIEIMSGKDPDTGDMAEES